MTYANIQVAVLENVVKRYLFEAEQDPKRSLRNLVALGREAARSKLQQQFLKIIQKMLEREDSPYYAMVQRTLQSVDHDRLLKFGIDLGWNSLTQGAKQIRRQEQQRKYHIPWSLTIHMGQGEGCLTGEDHARLIAQGKELGIHSYFLFLQGSEDIQTAQDMAASNQDCAFCLMLPDSCEKKKVLDRCCLYPNAIVGVNGCAPDLEQMVRLLQERGLLYLIYRYYATQEDVREIVSGKWADQIMPCAGIAAVAISAGSKAARESGPDVYQYVLDARMEQRYPTLMFDYYPDILYTDDCISGAPCFLGIGPDGSVMEYREGQEIKTGNSVRNMPIAEVLKNLRPEQKSGET